MTQKNIPPILNNVKKEIKEGKPRQSKSFKNLIAFIIIVVTLFIGVSGTLVWFLSPEWSKVFNDLFGELWPLMTGITITYFGFDFLKAKGGR